MFADGVKTEDVVVRIQLDLNRIKRITCEQRVAENSIFDISYTVPCYAVRLTASQYAERIHRNLHRQIHGEIIGDKVLRITYGIRVQTGCVK